MYIRIVCWKYVTNLDIQTITRCVLSMGLLLRALRSTCASVFVLIDVSFTTSQKIVWWLCMKLCAPISVNVCVFVCVSDFVCFHVCKCVSAA